MTKGRILYQEGKWISAATCLGIAKEVGIEMLIPALESFMWANRYAILKDEGLDKEAKKKVYYETVVPDINILLELTKIEKGKYTRERISAIKLLILIPDQDIEQLCAQGILELQESDLEGFEKDNLEGALLNSLGAFLKRTDTQRAIILLNRGYDLVEKGTTIAGHFKQNLGDCYQNGFRDESKTVQKREEAYAQAVLAWETALQEYPKKEKGHRQSVESRLTNIKKEKEKFDSNKEEKVKL